MTAKEVMDKALEETHGSVGEYVCSGVYDECKSNKENVNGRWTVVKVKGSNSPMWLKSGEDFVETNVKTIDKQKLCVIFDERKDNIVTKWDEDMECYWEAIDIMNEALAGSTQSSGKEICNSVYDSCVKYSNDREFEGSWTVAKVKGSNKEMWLDSGAEFAMKNVQTAANQYLCITFVPKE